MRFTLLIVLFVSLPALSCPSLEGTYRVCRTLQGETTDVSQVVVNQKIKNQMTSYDFQFTDTQTGEIKEENYEADGKLKEISLNDPDTGTVLKTQTTAICDGNFLSVKMNVTIDSRPLAKMTLKFYKDKSQLVQVSKGESMGEAVNYTNICE